MNNPTQERVWDWLLTQDPDVVVDVLKITTEELLEAFPEKVDKYIEEYV